MMCDITYHTPSNVVKIIVYKADSLGHAGGEKARGTPSAEGDRSPHVFADKEVAQKVWTTTSINTTETNANPGLMQSPMGSQPTSKPGP